MSQKEAIYQQCTNKDDVINALNDPNGEIVLIILHHSEVTWCYTVDELMNQWNIQTSEIKLPEFPDGVMNLPHNGFIVNDSLIKGIEKGKRVFHISLFTVYPVRYRSFTQNTIDRIHSIY